MQVALRHSTNFKENDMKRKTKSRKIMGVWWNGYHSRLLICQFRVRIPVPLPYKNTFLMHKRLPRFSRGVCSYMVSFGSVAESGLLQQSWKLSIWKGPWVRISPLPPNSATLVAVDPAKGAGVSFGVSPRYIIGTHEEVRLKFVMPNRIHYAGKHKVCRQPSKLCREGFDSPYPLQVEWFRC